MESRSFTLNSLLLVKMRTCFIQLIFMVWFVYSQVIALFPKSHLKNSFWRTEMPEARHLLNKMAILSLCWCLLWNTHVSAQGGTRNRTTPWFTLFYLLNMRSAWSTIDLSPREFGNVEAGLPAIIFFHTFENTEESPSSRKSHSKNQDS